LGKKKNTKIRKHHATSGIELVAAVVDVGIIEAQSSSEYND
jgi:hypothetical protein